MGRHPTDRGTIGTTRSLRTDGRGVPMGLAVEGAHRPDVPMTRDTSEPRAVERPDPTGEPPQGLGLDTGDDDDEVQDVLDEFGGTAPSRARGEEAHALQEEAGCTARRWVVERTQRWMHRFRRVLIRWDKHVCHDLGFLPLACAYMTYRQSGLLG